MNWIKIKEDEKIRDIFPKINVFLTVLNGDIYLTKYFEESDKFFAQDLDQLRLRFDPIFITKEMESDFTHYCFITLPEDF